MPVNCPRCRGSGTIGRRLNKYGIPGSKEAPGPVPDDIPGWGEYECPDCHGEGKLDTDTQLRDFDDTFGDPSDWEP